MHLMRLLAGHPHHKQQMILPWSAKPSDISEREEITANLPKYLDGDMGHQYREVASIAPCFTSYRCYYPQIALKSRCPASTVRNMSLEVRSRTDLRPKVFMNHVDKLRKLREVVPQGVSALFLERDLAQPTLVPFRPQITTTEENLPAIFLSRAHLDGHHVALQR
jgi:hypothetical protein